MLAARGLEMLCEKTQRRAALEIACPGLLVARNVKHSEEGWIQGAGALAQLLDQLLVGRSTVLSVKRLRKMSVSVGMQFIKEFTHLLDPLIVVNMPVEAEFYNWR
jgi:hypothetical protein